jgi:hypothetical protein
MPSRGGEDAIRAAQTDENSLNIAVSIAKRGLSIRYLGLNEMSRKLGGLLRLRHRHLRG